MGKIKEFYITTTSDEAVYCAGSVVEGKVIIDLIKPKATNGPLRIILSGKAKVQCRGQTAMRMRTDEQDMFNEISVHLWGTGSETLAPGKHEFPYTFHLPDDLPSSYEDLHGNIRYTLTAVLPTRKCEVTRQKIINVHGIIDTDKPDLELFSPLIGSDSKTLCCLCCTSAPIELSVVIDRGGYASGETIDIKENHRCRRITNVNATLLRKTFYHIRNESSTHFSCKRIVSTSNFTNINSFDEPGSRTGYLVIPNDALSINCEVLKVSYVVRVTLAFRLPMVKDLKVLIPITIGNVRRSATGDGTASASLSATIMPSAPPYPWSNTLESAPIQPSVIVPSAPVYPIPNIVPILIPPTQSNTELYEIPPPPYSEC